MKVLLVGKCASENVYSLEDPSAPSEDEFTAAVMATLGCLFPNHVCVRFSGCFRHEGGRFRPDLALVARNYSHWYVIEVELVTHSLDGHVLPQVRAFRYGEPDPDCAEYLARALKIPASEAATMVRYVPRSVVVIANRRMPEWEHALRGVGAQLVVVSLFTASGQKAVELDGQIETVSQSLAFGRYSAVDRSVRLPLSVALAEGEVQLDDGNGVAARWVVRRTSDAAWMTRVIGEPDLLDGAFVQVLRMVDGRIVMRGM